MLNVSGSFSLLVSVFPILFAGHPGGPAIRGVISAYLSQGSCNVVLLDWRHQAAHTRPSMANSYLNWAAPNARKVRGIDPETVVFQLYF